MWVWRACVGTVLLLSLWASECACNMLGTDATAAGACDATSGQCRCLPNVMGRQCDRCVPAHWKIAIGSGCEPCDCDPAGSTDEQCNEYDGQCRCRAGFGGRRCDQCEPRHWGDPRRGQCRQCQCNSQGSAAAQCDRESGRCQCRSGIGGDRCDRCARGHRGQAPDCQPCGECFDNWDRVLQQLQESTNAVVDEAEALERYGATGVYGAEFAQLNDWLDDVRNVLGNASLTDQQLDQLQLAIQRVRLNLSESESQLQSVETLADNTTHRLLLLDVRVPALRTRAQQLHAAAAALRDNATRLQEADVDGALALTREAQRRSKAAEISVMDTQRSLAEAGRQRRRTDNLLARATQRFNESRVPVQQLLRDATARLHAVEQQLPDINSQVCDGGGAPCDALCGGGGCDRCGGLSCDDGAATRAANALSVATDTVSVLAEREREVDELLRRVTAAKLAADEAYSVARAAFSDAQRLSNSSQQVEQRLQQLLEQIEELLQLPAATPQDIQRLAQQVLSKSISLRPEQISRLASEINETMSSLTDVNSILAETANDLNLANSLKQRADKAKQSAETILNTAEAVTTALQQAGIAQSTAGRQLTDTDAAVQLAQQQLASIVTASLSAERDANASVVAMQQLKARHKIVIKEFARNEINVARAVKEASLADEMAGKAHQKADQLDLNYRQAMATLNNETTAGSSSRLAVKQLLAQTSSLLAETVGQLNELEEINLEFSRHEDILSDMSDEIDSLHTRLDSYLHVITTRAEHYRTCQS